MITSPAAVWINSFFAGFDLGITQAIHNIFFPIKGFSSPFFDFISLMGKGGIFLILLSLALIFFTGSRRMGTAMLIAVTIGFLITNCCLKLIIARARPYADESSLYYQLWLLVGQRMESDNSFPSGHTTAAFATMTALFFTGNRKYSWTAFIFAFLMAVARIYLVVHFPSDCLAGMLVGFTAGVIATLITMKLPYRWFELDLIAPFKREKRVGAHQKGDQ
ncbi:MAG: phosphatase PAP2 family protein [Oscillospiraceae bacterium]|nr:phosphatase PAP2 family protein [Oscillospiraceae bacterium]